MPLDTLARMRFLYKKPVHTQPAFTGSKLTIEALEQGVTYAQS